MHIACIKHAIHIHKISAAERLQTMAVTCQSPNHFKTTTASFIKTQPPKTNFTISSELSFYLLSSLAPLLPVLLQGQQFLLPLLQSVLMRCLFGCPGGFQLRQHGAVLKTVHWRRIGHPKLVLGEPTSNNHLHPFTMNHQPQSINHNNNQQPQRPQSSLLCPASANDSPAPVKERCISTISTFNSPMRFIFLDNGTLKIRLK